MKLLFHQQVEAQWHSDFQQHEAELTEEAKRLANTNADAATKIGAGQKEDFSPRRGCFTPLVKNYEIHDDLMIFHHYFNEVLRVTSLMNGDFRNLLDFEAFHMK